MRTIFGFSLPMWAMIVTLAGCANYHSQPSTAPTVIAPGAPVETATDRQPNVLYRELQKRWAEDLKRDGERFSSGYDFSSDKAKELRSVAKGPKLQKRLEQKVSLTLLLCAAYERNPRLQEFREKQAAVEERYSQGKFLNNILDQYSSFARNLEISTGPALQKNRVAKVTPYPGSLELTGEIITTETKLAQLSYLIAERDLVYRITDYYWQLWYIEQALVIYQEHIELLEALENVAREKYKASLTSYSDVLKAQITREKISTDLKIIERQRGSVEIAILTALDLPTSISLGPVDNLPKRELKTHLSQLYKLAKQLRQEIQLSRLRATKLAQVISLAKDKLYPDFISDLSYYENRTKERSGDNAFADSLSAKGNVWFGQRDSYLREMRLQKSAVDKNVEDWEQKTVEKVRDLYWQLDRARQYLTLYRQSLIPLAQEDLRVTRSAYRGTGRKVDFLDVLEAERRLLDFELAAYRNRSDYRRKLAELEKTVGGSLNTLKQKLENIDKDE